MSQGRTDGTRGAGPSSKKRQILSNKPLSLSTKQAPSFPSVRTNRHFEHDQEHHLMKGMHIKKLVYTVHQTGMVAAIILPYNIPPFLSVSGPHDHPYQESHGQHRNSPTMSNINIHASNGRPTVSHHAKQRASIHLGTTMVDATPPWARAGRARLQRLGLR